MKRITRLILTMLIICAMSVTAFAEGITREQARDIAFRQAGVRSSQVKRLEVERDDGYKYEVEFVRKKDGAKFEYEISDSGKILEKSVDYPYKAVKSRKKIGKTAARKKAAKFLGISYSKVKNAKCTYKIKRGVGKYEIKFRNGDYRYEIEMLAKTGKVIEYEWEYVKK